LRGGTFRVLRTCAARVQSASLTRSAITARMGGRTPLANVYCAGCAMLALRLAGGAFRYLPKAVLAVIIVDAMRSMLRWSEARAMWAVRRRARRMRLRVRAFQLD
jgi:MFS superfamily sulfate permease-like transporter